MSKFALEKKRRTSRGENRVTLKDVAKLAGVGQITASRVLREPTKVSEGLRERVLEAMSRLGYIPNQIASGLASGASRVVPVIIPTLAHGVYVPFLQGVHEVLDAHGYEVLLGSTEYLQSNEARLISTVLGWYPAGVMVAGIDHLPATRQLLGAAVKSGVTVIEFMETTETPIDLNVGFSHYQVGVEVARYLALQGRTHIAYAGTFRGNDRRGTRRAKGFCDELRRLGLDDSLVLIDDEPYSIDLGRVLFERLLTREPRMDAIFFATDDFATAALQEAQRRGIDVPGQLAVMGFNDLEIARVVRPALSSVSVGLLDMGRTAARLLLDRLAKRPVDPRPLDLGFSIMERESTGPKATLNKCP